MSRGVLLRRRQCRARALQLHRRVHVRRWIGRRGRGQLRQLRNGVHHGPLLCPRRATRGVPSRSVRLQYRRHERRLLRRLRGGVLRRLARRRRSYVQRRLHCRGWILLPGRLHRSERGSLPQRELVRWQRRAAGGVLVRGGARERRRRLRRLRGIGRVLRAMRRGVRLRGRRHACRAVRVLGWILQHRAELDRLCGDLRAVYLRARSCLYLHRSVVPRGGLRTVRRWAVLRRRRESGGALHLRPGLLLRCGRRDELQRHCRVVHELPRGQQLRGRRGDAHRVQLQRGLLLAGGASDVLRRRWAALHHLRRGAVMRRQRGRAGRLHVRRGALVNFSDVRRLRRQRGHLRGVPRWELLRRWRGAARRGVHLLGGILLGRGGRHGVRGDVLVLRGVHSGLCVRRRRRAARYVQLQRGVLCGRRCHHVRWHDSFLHVLRRRKVLLWRRQPASHVLVLTRVLQ